eukprot:2531024-Amphidinium_carterae.1
MEPIPLRKQRVGATTRFLSLDDIEVAVSEHGQTFSWGDDSKACHTRLHQRGFAVSWVLALTMRYSLVLVTRDQAWVKNVRPPLKLALMHSITQRAP